MTSRLRAGEAGEISWCALMEQHGYVSFRTKGQPGRLFLPYGGVAHIAMGHDILGFDVFSVGTLNTVLAQIKSGNRYEGPDKDWRRAFLALPHPPGLLYLWCWWEGWQSWRVERLLPGGERTRIAWPPADGRAA